MTRTLNALLRRGLIMEQPASNSDEWRRDENGAPLTLLITPAGLAAIGVEANDPVPEISGPAGAAGARQLDKSIADPPTASGGFPDPARRPGTKGGVITALLRRDAGATLAELTAASGWQAHSVRGFLSGTLKRKLGYAVTSEKTGDGERRYRIAA